METYKLIDVLSGFIMGTVMVIFFGIGAMALEAEKGPEVQKTTFNNYHVDTVIVLKANTEAHKEIIEKLEKPTDPGVSYDMLIDVFKGDSLRAFYGFITVCLESGHNLTEHSIGKSRLAKLGYNNFGFLHNSRFYQLKKLDGFTENIDTLQDGRQWGYRVVNGDSAIIVQTGTVKHNGERHVKFSLRLTTDTAKIEEMFPHAVYRSPRHSALDFVDYQFKYVHDIHLTSPARYIRRLQALNYFPIGKKREEKYIRIWTKVKNLAVRSLHLKKEPSMTNQKTAS